MKGYKYTTVAEVNNAIQQVNTDNNFTPIQGNTTQTLVSSMACTFEGLDFYVISYDDYSKVLGTPTEIQID